MISFSHQSVDAVDAIPEQGRPGDRPCQIKRVRLQRECRGYSVSPVGDAACLVEFSAGSHRQSRLFAFRAALDRAKLSGVSEAVIGLENALVHYLPGDVEYERLHAELEVILEGTCATDNRELKGQNWRIPICYDSDCALDLDEVASRCGVTQARVVRLHSDQTYTVSMTGFMPGQPYLARLPEPLRLPRRLTPRIKVTAGSVAIATAMTVIYPSDCPAGWHIIGRTPVTLFDACADPPARLAPGDRVRFVPVLRGDYECLSSAVASNVWRLEPESESQCWTD